MPQFSVAIHEDADDLLENIINFSGTGDHTIISGTPGLFIQVYKLFLISSGMTVLTYKDGSAALTSAPIISDQILDFDTKPWFTLSVGNDLVINSSAPVQISGRIYYSVGVDVGMEGVPGGGPGNGYVTEDASAFYVAEDNSTFYVQES